MSFFFFTCQIFRILVQACKKVTANVKVGCFLRHGVNLTKLIIHNVRAHMFSNSSISWLYNAK